MSDWTEIDYLKLLVGKPVRSIDALALWENQFAIAEQADGAPYLQSGWHPHDGARVGDGNTGTFYDHAVDGDVASVYTPAFADGYEYMIFAEGVVASAGGGTLLVRVLKEGSPTEYGIFSGGAALDGFVEFRAPRRAIQSHGGIYQTSSDGGVFSADVGTKTALQKAAVSFSSGTISGGTMRLFRRRCFA